MRAPFHYVELSVFSLATEDVEKVGLALLFIAGEPELQVELEETTGHHKNPISILSLKLGKAKQIDAMFQLFSSAGLTARMLPRLEERFDDDLVLHIRLNKQEAYLEKLVLATEDMQGGVVSLRAKAEAYPKKRETGLKAVREYLEGLE